MKKTGFAQLKRLKSQLQLAGHSVDKTNQVGCRTAATDEFNTELNDGELFQQHIRGTTPIKQDKIHPRLPLSKQKKVLFHNENLKSRVASFYFSDEFEPALDKAGPMSFVQQGQPAYLAKQIRRGDYRAELILDLHGLTKAHAKLEIAALIEQCKKESLTCACIVHGIGERVLKAKVPHWLVQHPDVLAFHEAPLEYGGKGALLVLIKIPL